MNVTSSVNVAPVPTRKRAIALVARQLAIADGYNWQVAPNMVQAKKQATLTTRATNIVATIERMQLDFRWRPES